jgi:hypothetical protein
MADGFSYRSDNNTQWLKTDQLREMAGLAKDDGVGE